MAVLTRAASKQLELSTKQQVRMKHDQVMKDVLLYRRQQAFNRPHLETKPTYTARLASALTMVISLVCFVLYQLKQ